MYSAQLDRFVHDRLPPRDQWPDLRYDLPELQALPPQLNAVQWLFDRAMANGHAERPFLRSDERTLTYAQAHAEVNRFAQVLMGMGLQPGNRVLLRGGNSVAMALAWLAVVQSGLIAVATMPLLRATELKAIVDKARPSAALCDVKLQDELKAALAQSPDTTTLPLRLFNTGDAAVVLPDSLEALARHTSDTIAPCPTSADDIALLAFTSGTTGSPKAAVHTHRSRPARPGPATCCAPPPTTSSWAHRRWPSPSDWGACWCSPCGPAPRSTFRASPTRPKPWSG